MKLATELPPELTAVGVLQAGDNLDRAEFLRLWRRLPRLKRAELVGGIVYMPSPLSVNHGEMENTMSGWVYTYRIATPGCTSGNNISTFLLDDCPQPDVNLRIKPEYGGKSWVHKKYLHGTPEMFVEVCLTSAAYDLHQKCDLYEKAGVPEYIAVILAKQQIRWHRLVDGKYKLLRPDQHGVYRSRIFPGLWLDSKALFKDDMPRVLVTLNQGIASEEHLEFVRSLAAHKASK